MAVIGDIQVGDTVGPVFSIGPCDYTITTGGTSTTLYLDNNYKIVIGIGGWNDEYTVNLRFQLGNDEIETHSLLSTEITTKKMSIDIGSSRQISSITVSPYTDLNNIPYSNKSSTRSSGFHGLLSRVTNYVADKNDELDYYLSLCNEYIKPKHSVSSSISGITVTNSNIHIIGNYMHIYVALNLTSAAQTTIGTGDVTNVEVCNITIKDIYYPDYSSLNSVRRRYKISGYDPNSQTLSSGGGSGSTAGHVGSFYINKPTENGHDLAYPIVITALKAKSSDYTLRVVVPVTRCPWGGRMNV